MYRLHDLVATHPQEMDGACRDGVICFAVLVLTVFTNNSRIVLGVIARISWEGEYLTPYPSSGL